MAANKNDAVELVMEAFNEFKRVNDDRYHALEDHVMELAKVANRPGLMGRPASAQQERELAGALRHFLATGDESRFKNEMSTGSDVDGGYIVLPERSTGMTKKLFDMSPIRRLARVETIATGDAFEEPIDTDESGAEWVGEKEERPKTPTPQLKMVRVTVDETYALQPVTQRLIDDSYIDILGWLGGKLGDKFARQEGEAFVIGDGVKKPRGFLTQPVSAQADAVRPWFTVQYKPSGDAALITGDSLRDLVWSLRAPYRTGAVWLMNSNTASLIDKLKNGTGDYIWRDSSAAGVPPTLLGYAVEFDENMPDVSAGAYPIAFGNFRRAYLIVDKLGVRFLHDPYSDKPNVQLYAYRRVGGGLVNSEALKLLKIATS